MGHTFIDALKRRRSYYHLGGKHILPNNEVIAIIDEILSVMPSPFNVQSARVVILFGDQHLALWEIVEQQLRKIADDTKFEAIQKRLHRAFRGGCGTILFFEDETALEELRNSMPLYAERMTSWSEQSSGMLQFAIWTALEDRGYGASLQHYNPIIDDAVRERWLINASWRLIAQMPFGIPLDTPAPRVEVTPLSKRRLVYGSK